MKYILIAVSVLSGEMKIESPGKGDQKAVQEGRKVGQDPPTPPPPPQCAFMFITATEHSTESLGKVAGAKKKRKN